MIPPEIKLEREQHALIQDLLLYQVGFDKVTCSVASIGHPNADGSRQYARAINCILDEGRLGITTPCTSQQPTQRQGPPLEPRSPPAETQID